MGRNNINIAIIGMGYVGLPLAIEFGKVFTYAGTDKDDDAQLKIGLAYQSIGNVQKASEEFQRLVDYFPGSEYYPKAKEALKQLSVN